MFRSCLRDGPAHSFGDFPAESLNGDVSAGPAAPSQSAGFGLSGGINKWDIFLNDSDSIIYFFNAYFSCGLLICVPGYNSTWMSQKIEYLTFK